MGEARLFCLGAEGGKEQGTGARRHGSQGQKISLPPLPLPPYPFPLIHFPLSPPLNRRTPLLRLEGLEERLSSPSGSGRSSVAERILVRFRHKFALFECLNDEKFPVFILH